MLFKNVAGQKAVVYAYDIFADAPKTGDAANVTASISKDGAAGAPSNAVHPGEIGGGLYAFELTQAETNCDLFALYAASSTSGVRIDPVVAYTQAGAVPKAAAGTSGGLPTVNANNQVAGVAGDVYGRVLGGTSTTLLGIGVKAVDQDGDPPAKSADLAAVKTQTDKLSFAGFGPYDVRATLDGETVALAAAERNALADAILVRDVVHVEAAAGDHSLCYVVLALSESNTVDHAGLLTVYKTDGASEFVRKSLRTSPAADAITGIS
jgi:hypothetical protein